MDEIPYADQDPVDCPFCSRTLTDGSALSDHLQNQHPEEWLADLSSEDTE